jgi:hypothetical protein
MQSPNYMFWETIRTVVPMAVMGGLFSRGFAASKAVGVRRVESRVSFSDFASEAKRLFDFGSYARASASFSDAGRFSIRHIQSVQTTAMTRHASAIPPAPLSDL